MKKFYGFLMLALFCLLTGCEVKVFYPGKLESRCYEETRHNSYNQSSLLPPASQTASYAKTPNTPY